MRHFALRRQAETPAPRDSWPTMPRARLSLVEAAARYASDPVMPAGTMICLLLSHSTSRADRIRLLVSSPNVRSQPCLASSACISFQPSYLPVFARLTARRYISSLRLPIMPPFSNLLPGVTAADEIMSMSYAARRKKSGEILKVCPSVQRQLFRLPIFIRRQHHYRRIGQSRAFDEPGESGMRNILKPLISGNHSAASGDTKARTAAGTSPSTRRSIALVRLSLNWASVAPAAAIAVRRLALEADCPSSIAMSLLARSDTDLISARAMTRAIR